MSSVVMDFLSSSPLRGSWGMGCSFLVLQDVTTLKYTPYAHDEDSSSRRAILEKKVNTLSTKMHCNRRIEVDFSNGEHTTDISYAKMGKLSLLNRIILPSLDTGDIILINPDFYNQTQIFISHPNGTTKIGNFTLDFMLMCQISHIANNDYVSIPKWTTLIGSTLIFSIGHLVPKAKPIFDEATSGAFLSPSYYAASLKLALMTMPIFLSLNALITLWREKQVEESVATVCKTKVLSSFINYLSELERRKLSDQGLISKIELALLKNRKERLETILKQRLASTN